jgi:hypothetical protein
MSTIWSRLPAAISQQYQSTPDCPALTPATISQRYQSTSDYSTLTPAIINTTTAMSKNIPFPAAPPRAADIRAPDNYCNPFLASMGKCSIDVTVFESLAKLFSLEGKYIWGSYLVISMLFGVRPERLAFVLVVP